MRPLIVPLAAALTITSCNGQSNKAVKDQQAAYKVLEDMKANGLNPTTDGGWTMTATIDGTPWKASSIYNLELSARITALYKDSKISLPVPNFKVGDKTNFQNSAVDFSPVGNPDFWGGHSGGMEVTKVENGWAEGKFFFTATMRNSSKKIEVTNGFFRVPVKNK